MRIIDLKLSIPAHIWAVMHALNEDIEYPSVDEGDIDVSSRAFYATRGRAKGFLVSWNSLGRGTLNVTITEHGGGDSICVTDWQTKLPCFADGERPDDARMQEFPFRDVGRAAAYVEALAQAFMSGRAVHEVRPDRRR